MYFGIKNDGSIVGQMVSEKTLRDISQSISNHVSPAIYPQITSELVENKHIINVKFSGTNAPYFAYGRSYIRTADEDKLLSPDELEKMILNKNMYLSKWDSSISTHVISELNVQTLESFISTIKDAGRISIIGDNNQTILNKLEIAQNESLSYAAWHLFCDNQPIELQLAVFRGTDKTAFADFKHYKGNLFYLLDIAETYLKDKINWRVEFGNDMKRKEIPEIPVNTFREAIVNAFVHRDFNSPNGNEIAVFTDRIEIYNPGSFPSGLTPEDFIKGDEHSYLRNPKIAEMFYYTKNIDKWASGLQRISTECKTNNIAFEFKVLSNGFLTKFFRQTTKNDTLNNDLPAINSTERTSTVEKLGERLGVKLGERLGENALEILGIMVRNPQVTIRQLSEQLQISTTAIENNIKKLKENSLIERKGSFKSGYWETKKNV